MLLVQLRPIPVTRILKDSLPIHPLLIVKLEAEESIVRKLSEVRAETVRGQGGDGSNNGAEEAAGGGGGGGAGWFNGNTGNTPAAGAPGGVGGRGGNGGCVIEAYAITINEN